METSSEFLLGASVHGSLAVKIDPAFILRRLTTRCLRDCKSAFARTIVWPNLFLKRPSGLLVGQVGTVFWGERERARPPRDVLSGSEAQFVPCFPRSVWEHGVLKISVPSYDRERERESVWSRGGGRVGPVILRPPPAVRDPATWASPAVCDSHLQVT